MKVDNKKIAKNTVYMYLRLLVTIPLAFYTSRVVLRELGVDNFGIYQAVSGIITMFIVLRGAFDSATQRYYNVALANNDTSLLSQMYSTSVIIHAILTSIFILIIEIFGQWFIKYKMQYPTGAENDVYFVFHTTVISIIFIIMNIPFTGMIIAREHMKFYAYISILDVILKLGLVFLLIFESANKLKLYAVFQLCVPIIVFTSSAVYFNYNFSEIKLSRPSRKLYKEMFSFSGWGLLGNICYSLVNEGVNLLLNVYGGVIANTARGIAFQVRGVITNILTTTIMPVRPQATQLYIIDNKLEFWDLIYSYSKVLFILGSFMVIPIFVYTRPILILWLGIEPQYSSIFLQILMIYTLIRSFHEPLDIYYKAAAKMRLYQLTTVSISSMSFFLGWITLRMNFPIYTPFIVLCIIESILLIALSIRAHGGGISYAIYFKCVIIPCVIYATIGLFCCMFIKMIISEWYIGIIFSILILIYLSFLIVLSKKERDIIYQALYNKFHH